MRIRKSDKRIIWDYDLDNINLKKEEIKIWYLNRKINYGDFLGITKKDLIKYLPKLKISPAMRKLLTNFIKTYARD